MSASTGARAPTVLAPQRPEPPVVTERSATASTSAKCARPSRATSATRGPNEYAQAVYRHSQRSIVTSSFPGRNYIDFADWLLHPNHSTTPSTEKNDDDPHWLAVLHNLDGSGAERTQAFGENDITSLATQHRPALGLGHLLFLRGYVLPSWLVELGSKYRVDPEFFCRHPDFLRCSPQASCFGTPSVVSTSNNIIHVNVNTIVSDPLSYSDTNGAFIPHSRSVIEQMTRYRSQLQRTAGSGDSIVRDYIVLNEQYSVIQQRISICIADNGDGWLGLIWMDHGRSLEASPQGPWIAQKTLRPAGSTPTAMPVIQHHPKMAFRNLGDVDANHGFAPAKVNSSKSIPQARHLPQSTLVLPMEYLSLLSAVDLAKRARHDPFHALVPIFAHAAFSDVALLNLVTELLEELMAPLPVDDFRNDSFERLQHYDAVVQKQANQLRHCVRAIRVLGERSALPQRTEQVRPAAMRPSTYGPPASPGKHHHRHQYDEGAASPHPATAERKPASAPSSFSTAGILEDYEDLLARSGRLQARIAAAMSTEMNRAMVLESRRAIEQSERTKKLTILATYFIPLTFAASLFGMNFEVLGQGTLSPWWYIVLAAPLTLLTHLIYSWGVKAPRMTARGGWLGRRLQRWRTWKVAED